jgi:hypothetical protein
MLTFGFQGNVEALEKQYWPLIVIVVTTGVVTAVSQLFMISRYWQMLVFGASMADTPLTSFWQDEAFFCICFAAHYPRRRGSYISRKSFMRLTPKPSSSLALLDVAF